MIIFCRVSQTGKAERDGPDPTRAVRSAHQTQNAKKTPLEAAFWHETIACLLLLDGRQIDARLGDLLFHEQFVFPFGPTGRELGPERRPVSSREF